MKVSKFIISQSGFNENTILLYSTISTSIVELEREMYNKIFVDHDYSNYKFECDQLKKFGFLIDDNFDELFYLEEIRKKTINSNKSSPTYYIICPTTECNARCYYCFEKGTKQVKMDNKTINGVINYIINNHDENNLVIQWFGGEPLLEPDIIDKISKSLKDNNINFTAKIITNGFLLNENIIHKAKYDWNVKTIQVTIDDLYEKYNKIKNYIYNTENAFDIVLKNIQLCLKKGIHMRIRINFNPLTYDNSKKIIDFLNEYFNKNENLFIYLAPIDSNSKMIPSITNKFNTMGKHPIISLLETIENCSFGNYDYIDESTENNDYILKKYFLNPIPLSCYGGCQSSLTIDSEGKIFVCHRLLGRQEYSSGDVFEGRINNDIYKHYSNPIIDSEECNSCELLPICQGGCKYRAFKYGKDHSCTSIKGAVNELIKRAAKEMQDE